MPLSITMKKAFKLMALCFVAMALSMNFAACGDDDDNTNNNGGTTPGGNDNGGIPATAMSSTTGRNVAVMNMYDQTDVFFLYDDQGRIIEQYFDFEGTRYTSTYEYYENRIEGNYTQGNTTNYSRTFTLTDGLITAMTEQYGGDTTLTTCQYQDRYLVDVVVDDFPYYTFVWQDGNLVSSNDYTSGITTYSYNENSLNSNRVELYTIFGGFTDYGLLLQGYYGNSTRHHISQMNTPSRVVPLTYTVDESGDVTCVSFSITIYGEEIPMPTHFTWQ